MCALHKWRLHECANRQHYEVEGNWHSPPLHNLWVNFQQHALAANCLTEDLSSSRRARELKSPVKFCWSSSDTHLSVLVVCWDCDSSLLLCWSSSFGSSMELAIDAERETPFDPKVGFFCWLILAKRPCIVMSTNTPQGNKTRSKRNPFALQLFVLQNIFRRQNLNEFSILWNFMHWNRSGWYHHTRKLLPGKIDRLSFRIRSAVARIVFPSQQLFERPCSWQPNRSLHSLNNKLRGSHSNDWACAGAALFTIIKFNLFIDS